MKTNIELAREAGVHQYERFDSVDGGNQLDCYTALVEARLMAKLLEGTGELVEYVRIHDGHEYLFTKACDDYYTPDQIAAAVLRERELFSSELELAKKTHVTVVRRLQSRIDALEKESVKDAQRVSHLSDLADVGTWRDPNYYNCGEL